VNQGIAVYGNKGSTDQHAYVQQLREGVNNFFVTFIEVLKDRSGPALQVEPGVTSGDYLLGFYLGTRDALSEKDRHSITVTVDELSPRSLGMLIALYERAVGFYASLVGINAYHQPGVEAGKKAATGVLALQQKLVAILKNNPGRSYTAESIAKEVDGSAELSFKILNHLASNGAVKKQTSEPWFNSTFAI
jgi:glucose-6-phosphate isomerase